MKIGRFTSVFGILLLVGGYWVGYFAVVRPQAPAVFSNRLSPDYRVPPPVQAPAHCLFNAAYFVDSHFLRPAKWDALRVPPVLLPTAN
jgi:hypothetical protein